MKDQPRAKPKKAKKQYSRPQIKQVPLRPEEAVLGNCKNSTSSGPTGSGCGFPAYCSSAGS